MTQTEQTPVLIVAHGQPSAPKAAAADLAVLAAQVAAHLPAHKVRSVTLAQEGGLARAIADLGPSGLVFPMFMAGGWFTRVALAQKLRAASGQMGGGAGWQVLEPFGCDPAVHDLAAEIIAQALVGQNIAQAQILIAAHGSFKSSVPSDIANHLATHIAQRLGIADVKAAFIDQSPILGTATGYGAGAVCLPFFAAAGGHVSDDIPRALAQAGFGGRVLPPLGIHGDVPGIIAAAIRAARPVCAEECRYRLNAAQV